MTNVIKMLSKTLRLFTISFNQANAVYVKIYETALNHKANIGRYLYRVVGLYFQLSRTHYHLSLVKYSVH
jgi:hypothetical protein